ncbi:MAG: T9SS type A sorting domain-containing protein [Bacteroidota bacterium]
MTRTIMKWQTSLLFLILVSCTVGVLAQPDRKGHNARQRGPLPEEVKAYMQEKILPAVEAQRAKLDEELSDQELADIASIRGGLKMLKEEKQDLQASLRELRQTHEGEGRPELPEELKENMHEVVKAHRQLITQAWEIVDANEEVIEFLMEGLQPQAGQWREDIRALLEANKPEEGRKQRKAKGEEQGMRPYKVGFRGTRGLGVEGGMRRPLGKLQHPVAFLLFDASLWEIEEVGVSDLNVFPNPTLNQNTLEYTIEQAGNVEITLLDKSGKTIKQLVSTPKEAGTYRLSVDFTDLRPGLYIYKIQTEAGTQTKKLLVE